MNDKIIAVRASMVIGLKLIKEQWAQRLLAGGIEALRSA